MMEKKKRSPYFHMWNAAKVLVWLEVNKSTTKWLLTAKNNHKI